MDQIAAAYNEWANQYDTNVNVTRDLDATILRTEGPHIHDRDVLELGCGTGKNSEWLARHARSLVAMDFSSGMLDVARARVLNTNVRFVQHDIQQPWPIDSSSVDVLVGDLVLEHIEQLSPVFAEAHRVLRSGGELFFCELHPFRQWRGVQARYTDANTQETVLVTAFRHSTSEFVNAAIAAGFVLQSLGEWTEDGAPSEAPPRLLSTKFTRT